MSSTITTREFQIILRPDAVITFHHQMFSDSWDKMSFPTARDAERHLEQYLRTRGHRNGLTRDDHMIKRMEVTYTKLNLWEVIIRDLRVGQERSGDVALAAWIGAFGVLALAIQFILHLVGEGDVTAGALLGLGVAHLLGAVFQLGFSAYNNRSLAKEHLTAREVPVSV